MSEPDDRQLTRMLDDYLAQHAEVDEEKFGLLLAELVAALPRSLRKLMEDATAHGGAHHPAPRRPQAGRRLHLPRPHRKLGTIDLRACVRGPAG